MSTVQRIDPRRPASIGPSGLRRIVAAKRGAAIAEEAEKPLRTFEAPARWHMVIAHSDRGSLDEHARQAIAAAAILSDAKTGVIVAVLGELSEDLAKAGADLVAVFPDLDGGRFQPDRELAAITSLLGTYAPLHIFMPDTAMGDGDLGRRLIASLGMDAATRVVELDNGHIATPWSGGGVLATAPLPRVVLLTAGAVDSAIPFAGAGKVTEAAVMPRPVPVSDRYRDLGCEETTVSSIALEEADFIVSAGNGVRNIATLEALAQTLGASVGASRVAVDDGKFPRDKQIGATGKTVAASAYIAVGISGAVQHLQGIKDCRHVIALNNDAGAPIVKRADLTIVGDAEDVMQALIKRIAQARAQREFPGDI
ncbi:MAG: electron transfer flavoprotein subunit alpha/FixB family protein [Hyphomicrobium sp.]